MFSFRSSNHVITNITYGCDILINVQGVQLGWTSGFTSAGRITLASGTTFLHRNTFYEVAAWRVSSNASGLGVFKKQKFVSKK